MTASLREEFWRRFYVDIERFREQRTGCDIAVNPFAAGHWRVKFIARRVRGPSASMAIAIAEHVAARNELLLAVTPTATVEDAVTEGERFLIPVLHGEESAAFVLHADHGPVPESHFCDYFARMAGALLDRL